MKFVHDLPVPSNDTRSGYIRKQDPVWLKGRRKTKDGFNEIWSPYFMTILLFANDFCILCGAPSVPIRA